MVLLEVALSGGRDHPAMPKTPLRLAEAAVSSVAAGARAIHLHAYDSHGRETLAPEVCDAAVRAVHAACPGVPVSLTTSAGIEPDPRRRLAAITAWSVLPELVTANQGEAGIVELCDHLLARGVGLEAGLLSVSDARAFVDSGLADRCVRVLVEPLDAAPGVATIHASAIEVVLERAGVTLEQVHHGDGVASWVVNQRALWRGHGIRTGLEDTGVLPDGREARDNAELVEAGARMIAALPPR